MTSEQRPVEPENAGVTPERVKELADQGHGRNAVMRITGATRHAVDKAAEQAGVTWDRSATREAVAALRADAVHEREALAAQFREVGRVVISKVLQGGEDLTVQELRDLVWTAGSAASSDARLGELSLKQQAHDVLHSRDTAAQEQFGQLLSTLRDGFRVLDSIPYEELDPDGEYEAFGTGGYGDQDHDDGPVGWE